MRPVPAGRWKPAHEWGGGCRRFLIYRVTGPQGLIRVPRWIWPECDLTLAAVRAAVAEAGLGGAAVELPPWLTHLGQAFRRRGWTPTR